MCTFPGLGYSLSRWVESCFPQRKKLLNEDFFKKRLELAVKNAGFQVLQCGGSLADEIVPRNGENSIEKDPAFNAFLNRYGTLSQLKIDLPNGMVKKASALHLLVLKKPS